MKFDVDADKAVLAKVAEAILAQIGTESRDAILTKSVQSALADYTFKHVIEQAVCDEAARHASEMLLTDAWQQRFHKTVIDSVERLMAKLPDAIECSIKEALFGTGETYGGHSKVISYLNRDNERLGH